MEDIQPDLVIEHYHVHSHVEESSSRKKLLFVGAVCAAAYFTARKSPEARELSTALKDLGNEIKEVVKDIKEEAKPTQEKPVTDVPIGEDDTTGQSRR